MTASDTTRGSGIDVSSVESAHEDTIRARLKYIRQLVETDGSEDLDELREILDEAKTEIVALHELTPEPTDSD